MKSCQDCANKDAIIKRLRDELAEADRGTLQIVKQNADLRAEVAALKRAQ